MRKKQLRLAHSSLVEEAVAFRRTTNRGNMDQNYDDIAALNPHDERAIGRYLGERLKQKCKINQDKIPYVSETVKPLKGYYTDEVPLRWFARPPPRDKEYRLTQLWGWRTNLEHAINNFDEERVKKITSQHTREEIREFCEIRQLLQKCASKGLVKGCELLFKYCKVRVEGKRASTFPDAWLKMAEGAYREVGAEEGGGREFTPLIEAAREGHYEVCKLLLENGASISMTDMSIESTALHHAISQGQRDVVRLLCNHNSDLSSQNIYGQDSIDLVEHFMQPAYIATCGIPSKQFEKIAEILREHDDRCSYCKSKPTELKNCPCHKEK